MELSTLTLQQFRSYKKETLQFSPSVTLVIGPNTAGKTNILEAVYCLATGKSFRAEKESDMIAWGEEVGRVKARCMKYDVRSTINDENLDLELVITTGEVNGERTPTKKYIVNGVPRRQIDFVGNLRTVLFSPEDLDLITDSPSLRRSYLNSILVQTDREYRRNLYSYERGLRQRNKLLDLIGDGKANRSQLLFWNQLLITSGSYITEKREALINFMNNFQSVDQRIDYQIVYDKSVISENRLDQYKDEEVAARTTLVGPQRDDFIITKLQSNKSVGFRESKDGFPESSSPDSESFRDVSRFGSRGEQRLAVLWLKLAELSYIEQETGERPILLLDDIFSELDEESRNIVLSIIYMQQTIITSAEEEVRILFHQTENIQVIQLPRDLI